MKIFSLIGLAVTGLVVGFLLAALDLKFHTRLFLLIPVAVWVAVIVNNVYEYNKR